MNADSADWDLAHPLFKRQIINYLHSDNLSVKLVIPEVKYDSEVEEELWLLQKLGVELARGNSNKKGISAQLRSNERVTTLAIHKVILNLKKENESYKHIIQEREKEKKMLKMLKEHNKKLLEKQTYVHSRRQYDIKQFKT